MEIDNFNDHQPVLLAEVIENLTINPDGIYVDATFGRGGHSMQILKHLSPRGRLFVMDKDPEAISYAKKYFAHDKRFTIYHGSFAELQKFLESNNVFGKVNGVLFDLGVSSPQLDNPERGFSFMHKGMLDMRMDYSRGMDAAAWIAKIPEKELADILYIYGEERFSRRIARSIVNARQENPITTTHQLAEIVAKAVPVRQKGKHPATQTFQAIRIAINDELNDLRLGLQQALEALSLHGRLLVISFHSLEDRIAKQFIQQQEKGDQFPHRMPVTHDKFQPRLKRIGNAVKPSSFEIAENPRARSAILRIGEKLS